MPKASTPVVWQNRIVGLTNEPPESLRKNPKNWRTHPEAQSAALRGVLGQLGWIGAVLKNDTTGNLIDGHDRMENAIATQQPTVPVLHVQLSQAEEDLALATYDPLSAMAGQDDAMLTALLADLSVTDAGLADMLRDLAPDVPKALHEDDADLTPPATPITRPGDLWLLGEHRLLCSDAADPAAHEQLLDGTSIDVVLTDPPYGVGIDYGLIDDSRDVVQAIVDNVLPLLLRWPVALITPGVTWLWLYPPPTWLMAWVHPAPMGRGPWGFTSHNPILAYGSDPKLKAGQGSYPDAFVMAADRLGETGHPTMKPIAVWSWLMERATTRPGEAILDVFAGSGTSIIAAEQLGHRCFAMEINPAYVDVSVRRWENLAGRKAVRDGKALEVHA